MARDWGKVALAVLTAAALASVCALDSHAQATKQPAKSAKKSPEAKSPGAEAKQPEEGEDAPAKAPAKKKRQDPVEAQRAIEAATKLLQAGKADQAAQALTATLSGGNLPAPIMAKALYARGIAYRLQSKPAQAISDLTSALWLKGGLPEAERADALKQRAAAYSDAGLTESGEAVAPSSATTKERPASPAKSWNTATTSSDPAPTGQTGGNWFNNIFNLPASAAQPAKTPQSTASIEKRDPPAVAPQPPAGQRVSTAWSSNTQVRSDRQPDAGRVAAAPPPPPPSKAEGRFRAQLATVRTQQEAVALAAKAKREHAAALAAREPEIDQAVVGNMGSFYRVRVGPFATVQEAQAVCARLKGSGFDCLSVTQ